MTSVSMPIPPKRKRLGADFWKFWTGQTISNLGSSITLFALPLIVFNLTHSALNLGISAAADMLPYPLFGLLLGAMTDRVNRKRMMILTDIGRAAVVGSIPFAFTFGIGSVWWIYGVGFLQSTLTICFESGQFAAIPSLVGRDDIVTANGRIQASYSGASVLGPFLAGLLVALLPVTNLMIFDAASFLISSFSLSLVRTSFNSDDGERERKNIFRDVVEGLRYVVKHPVLRNISLMMCLVNFIAVTAGAQLVLFAHNQLNASKTQIAWLFTASAMGVVVLALLAGPLRKRWSFSRVALGALMTEGVLQAIFSQLHWYWLALPIWGIAGGCGILFNINTGSLRQTIVPSHLLGRVLSIASVLAWSAIPLGALLGGYTIQATHNVALVYFAIGVLTFLVPLIFSFTALGHADRYLPKNDEKTTASVEERESPVTA
ncbi:MAG TPA: MFS transporter [Ktedonobacterales bacterium]|nr:MFS transporter [Ktedonobacterales bacterium]